MTPLRQAQDERAANGALDRDSEPGSYADALRFPPFVGAMSADGAFRRGFGTDERRHHAGLAATDRSFHHAGDSRG